MNQTEANRPIQEFILDKFRAGKNDVMKSPILFSSAEEFSTQW
jgi:hypothetical protein